MKLGKGCGLLDCESGSCVTHWVKNETAWVGHEHRSGVRRNIRNDEGFAFALRGSERGLRLHLESY